MTLHSAALPVAYHAIKTLRSPWITTSVSVSFGKPAPESLYTFIPKKLLREEC
ncbi:MAG: hypothetical protein HXS48_22270 [Theionarchaea archaeon]|nr:hypothetical protein [Theionarchaea archaeon]